MMWSSTREPRLGLLGSILTFMACSDAGSAASTTDTGPASGSSLLADASPVSALDAGDPSAADAGPLAARLQPVIDNQGWRRFDATLDPLRAHQPAELSCPASATFVEYGSFEVDTTRCNYVLTEHPAQLAVPAGTELKMELLHYDLTAPEPAEAHLALLFGDALQWETRIPIPKAGDVIKASFTATKALALGEPIRLHLHNHGGNAYLFVSLQAKQ